MKQKMNERSGIEYYMKLPYSILLHEVEDDGKKYWMAEVPELPGCKAHGSTVEEAVKSVEEAKKDWILDSLAEKEEVPIPIERYQFSGKTLLRMSRSLHRALTLMAESEKLSLNQLVVTILAKEIGRFAVLNRVEEKIDKALNRISDLLETEQLKLSPPNSIRLISQPYGKVNELILGVEGASDAANTAVGTSPSICSRLISTAFQDDAWPLCSSPLIVRDLPHHGLTHYVGGEKEEEVLVTIDKQ